MLCVVSLGGILAYQVACLNKNVNGLIVTILADIRKMQLKR